ncbi:MAG: TldD/PmbA family protein [Spirochaetes bacterium]|nr:TldD/PmbA family protein [Spirochaetota bacterium]MBU1082092.1 TldD/PmbA family protein [Spirochaetota bacterium]
MRSDLRRLLDAAAAAAKEADWLGLRRRRTSAAYYMARDGAFDQAIGGVDDGVMVEVLFDGRFAYAATPDATPAGVARAAASAMVCAKAAAGRGVYPFSQAQRPGTVAEYRTPRARMAPVAPDGVFAFLLDSCAALKASDEVIQTTSIVEVGRYDFEIVSTNGADIEQALHYMGTGLQAVARRGDVVQLRTANGPRGLTRQGGWELLDTEALLADARRTGAEAVELLGAETCPSDRRTLVLTPDQMMLQIHESVGHPLELDRILGDERNYAGSSFVKLPDFGSFQYGSKLMNISFDPTIAGELASYGADEIGAVATKQLLIENGILVRGLGSLESQARSGVAGVADQRATSWNRPPIDRMANLNLEPGSTPLADMIASIEKGVLMRTNRSWSIDDYRNKFQFGCEYGTLIEDGKLTRTVRDPNYRGVSSTFWRNLCSVGDASTFAAFGTPNCGKGEPNQVMFVGHASPVCAFADVEVFGGGK